MEEASRQDDASSYGDDDVAGSELGRVLSFESEDEFKFEEEYHDKIYNRPISSLAVACLGLFGRQISRENSSVASDKPGTTSKNRKELAKFIVDMNDTFRCWMAETADLAEKIIHDLDSLFNEYKDRKVMAVDVFKVLIEALQYVNSGETERLCIEDEVIKSIQWTIEELFDLTEEIREASRRNDDLSLDVAFPFDDTASVRGHMLPVIRQMFPHARRSLCDHLALSVAIRRRRLRRMFKDAERFKARIARRARSQVNANQAYPQPSESQPQPQPFYTLAPSPHSIEGSTASTDSFDASTMPSIGTAYSNFSIESASPSKNIESSVRLSTCKYPPRLHFPPEAADGICSYCAQRTTPSFLSRRPEIWEFHVNRDVRPFVCLSEQCRSPVLFFASVEGWIEHMNKMHSHEWTRRIHPASWICDAGHDAIQFKDVESFREHMNDKDSHPITPDGHKLRVLEIEQWRYLPHDEYMCPLCDFTLDMPKRSISTDVAGCDLYRPLHKHIAGHLKDLAVLSLPILDATEGPEFLPDNQKAEETRNWLGESTKESCPRGHDQEVCGTFVSDVHRNSYISQEQELMKRRKSEPRYVAYPMRSSFDGDFMAYSMRNSFDEEFGTYLSTLQVFTAYET